jgi:hypothetical protein
VSGGGRLAATCGRALVLALAAVAGAAATLATGCCGGGSDNSMSASGLFSNQTQMFLNVFTDSSTNLYVRPGQEISLGVSDGHTVKVAFSPGQDAPDGIVATETVSCCCTTGATCDNEQCGTVSAVPSGNSLTLSYNPAVCFTPVGGGSCPYVYAMGADGRAIPQAEALSAALFAGAARGDVLPLPGAAVVGGEVRVRVATELREIDVLTGAALLAIDHEPGVELATDTDGRLAAVASPLPPSSAASPGLPDQLPLVAARDGAGWVGSFSSGALRDMLTVRFPPARQLPRDRLVLVVRNIRSTEKVLQRYLAELGPGFPGLLRRMSGLPGYRGKLEKILGDSGLALRVTTSQPGRSSETRSLLPVGSLGARAVALELPGLDPALPVEVRLDALPTAWEVDTVFLARAAGDRVVVTESAPTRALKSDGSAAALTERTPYRQVQGQHLDLTFEVPTVAPAAVAGKAGLQRSFALAVRGHYELVPGPGIGVDWGLLALRTMPGSHGSFGRYLRGDSSEPRWSLCPKRILRDLLSDRRAGAGDGAKLACAQDVAR